MLTALNIHASRRGIGRLGGHFRCALLVCVVCAPAASIPADSPAQLQAAAQLVAQLATAEDRQLDDAFDALVALRAAGALAVLPGFAEAPTAARRARARVLAEAGSDAQVDAAMALVRDQDPIVRASIVRFLSRADLGPVRGEERARALLAVAREDGHATLRAVAIEGLSTVDSKAALDALQALVADAPRNERVQAARALAGEARARGHVLRIVVEGVADEGALAELLPIYARTLAERPGGLERDAALAPLVRAASACDAAVRLAARRAIESALSRLEALREFERAIAFVRAVGAAGIDPWLLLEHEGRLWLLAGGDEALQRATQVAAELMAFAESADDEPKRALLARGLQLCALISIAEGDLAGAAEPLAREALVLDDLLARRAAWMGFAGRALAVSCAQQRALCALTEGFCRLALARNLDTAPALLDLEPFRAAHAYAIDATAIAWRGGLDDASGFDPLLHADASPLTCILDVPRHSAWPLDRRLSMHMRFARALATVAPRELPGFEPFAVSDASLGDVQLDTRRQASFHELLRAEFESLSADFLRGRLALEREKHLDLCAPDARALYEDALRVQRLEDVSENLERARRGDGAAFADLRLPSSLALETARELSDHGRSARARTLLDRAREDLDQLGALQNSLWGLEFRAEIEMTSGSTWMDEGDPRKAEVELSKSVARLDAMEQSMRERGFDPRAIVGVRARRSAALVSLAVNANVKLGQPERAVAFFERAWEIRQDDFMRVLLACYRARQQRAAEARALLVGVAPGPSTYYNFACTYALLGDDARALEFLARELAEHALSPGALARQQEWSRGDPDLASLRGDPRFESLVGK